MRNQLQLSQATETLNRGKSYIEVFKEIMDLKEMCHNIGNSVLLEYVPVKIVACFEQFFRDEYMEILLNPKSKQRLKNVDFFKNAKFDFDLLGAFEDSTITLGEYLSLLIPCSKLEDINKALSQLLGIDFLHEFEKYDENNTLESINELFQLRHIYCHEVPLGGIINFEKATKLINASKCFLEFSDDIIRYKLYSDQPTSEEEFEIAKSNYEKANCDLEALIEKIQSKTEKSSFSYSDFGYIKKWKEYREERAKCESLANKDFYSPVFYQRSLERTTRTLIKELKDDYKYELKRW